MCFSASASFLVGTSLLVVGTATLGKATRWAELPFALIPLLFGVQQLVEGGIWLGLRSDAAALSTRLTLIYSLFAHVVWPVYIPLAMLLLVPTPAHKRVLIALVGTGIAVALYLLDLLVQAPLRAELVDGHIRYATSHDDVPVAMVAYLAATCFSLLFSNSRVVVTFGFVALLSCVAAYTVYTQWFISVWCFFAALLSGMVYLYFRNPIPCEAPQRH